MQIERLAIPDVIVFTPRKHGDERGYFCETFRRDLLVEQGVDVDFVQDNHAHSLHRGVLRGLHFQAPPHAQGKLVRCARGAILDVAVDIRRGSPTFGYHVAEELSEANGRQIWVPPGFAHGYVTLEANCDVVYKTTAYYNPASEGGLAWNDPALGIDWRVESSALIIAGKDQHYPSLAEAPLIFDYAI